MVSLHNTYTALCSQYSLAVPKVEVEEQPRIAARAEPEQKKSDSALKLWLASGTPPMLLQNFCL